MSTFKRKRISFFARLRNYFITGIVVLIPIGLTLYLTKFIIDVSSKLLPKELNPNFYLPFKIPGLEIIVTVIFITFIDVVKTLNIKDIKKLIYFFTDNQETPPSVELCISSTPLFSAHTCFTQLDIANIKDFKTMKNILLFCINQSDSIG